METMNFSEIEEQIVHYIEEDCDEIMPLIDSSKKAFVRINKKAGEIVGEEGELSKAIAETYYLFYLLNLCNFYLTTNPNSRFKWIIDSGKKRIKLVYEKIVKEISDENNELLQKS